MFVIKETIAMHVYVHVCGSKRLGFAIVRLHVQIAACLTVIIIIVSNCLLHVVEIVFPMATHDSIYFVLFCYHCRPSSLKVDATH